MSARSVIPAHLSYFAIYNPSLGPTDETLRDQIVFYYSHDAEVDREQQAKGKPAADGSRHATSVQDNQPNGNQKKEEEAEENHRLRQVGLAQGMVNFAKNFSNGVPLESMEAEKSRTVLKEVEPQWWIIAAIHLTQLPSVSRTPSGNKQTSKSGTNIGLGGTASKGDFEYSSREVAPAPLLLAQLIQGYRGFLLHHASSLSELWKKHENNRDLFCSLLHRYWTRFVYNWDVLLHGHPATDIYDAVKLAGGGELGVGVGEEEWGSGEREVLEGFAGRTEGLVDLIVGRYGDAPPNRITGEKPKDVNAVHPSPESQPWLGNGEDSKADDGVVFSGIGGISRPSLVTLSQWMESIYMHGDAAYGVVENPASRLKHRRKKRKLDKHRPQGQHSDHTTNKQVQAVHPRVKSPGGKPRDLRRRAIENNATPPGIPPPLVSAVERSLDNAMAKLDAKSPNANHDHRSEGDAEPSLGPSEQVSMFNTEKMMKYLSLGYGTSWTLSPKGFNIDKTFNAPDDKDPGQGTGTGQSTDPAAEELQELDPTPEVSDEEETPFVQRLEESIGKFLIGLSGDLENTEFEDESNDERVDGDPTKSRPPLHVSSNRIFLRTLVVEMSTSRFSRLEAEERPSSLWQSDRNEMDADSRDGKTSASASVDGVRPIVTHEKVQVAVYVHQPFIFVFLFRLHTPNLTVPGFYRAIHHTLGPLQKSLLRSTDPERWRERMRASLGPDSSSVLEDGDNPRSLPDTNDVTEIYDLLYDPLKSTLRTSIPNIPLPGSLAAEGLHRAQQNVRPITVSGSWYTLGIPIGSSSTESGTSSSGSTKIIKSEWTRIEALNVHTHILNTWVSTRDKNAGITNAGPNGEELERTIKTARGWWIVWMKVLPSEQQEVGGDDIAIRSANQDKSTTHSGVCGDGLERRGDLVKEAILVRRSAHERTSTSRDTSRSRSDAGSSHLSGKWLLRDQPRSREVSGSGRGMSGVVGMPGSTTAKGVTEGVGVDAKKWVEALIRLSF
ncbi:hypothetical protein, variant 1 [Cladophialophora immunda]|uniref:CCZ1/INTU/HSP4 first Longin domain-containing protein n=2 Tax=Cladophialophora immunda TaxID=569365 RepID=A0A0D2D8X1_9EURO|nr:uncharacterized protein PV07_03738 [Cladophialophora immunda]XP_016252391.1 hypothetical protein, variant 1 [Cladophialophora immunda]KIW32174.1 hypothetical protein PV07_03738 [Cladophialophora immunda]KIW32175.1 hypothetical protein, variant 1 [Cladophialophora immunda]